MPEVLYRFLHAPQILVRAREGSGKGANGPNEHLPGAQLVRRRPILDAAGIRISVQYAVADVSTRRAAVAKSSRAHKRLLSENNEAARKHSPDGGGMSPVMMVEVG